MQQFRRIKVGYATRSGQQVLQVRNARGGVTGEKVRTVFTSCPVPAALRGDWLSQAGFGSGDRVRVEVSDGRLVISREGGEGI